MLCGKKQTRQFSELIVQIMLVKDESAGIEFTKVG